MQSRRLERLAILQRTAGIRHAATGRVFADSIPEADFGN